MGLFDRFRQKAKENPEQVQEGLGKVSDVADEKTGGKYSEQIDMGTDKAEEYLGVGGEGGGEGPGDGGGGPREGGGGPRETRGEGYGGGGGQGPGDGGGGRGEGGQEGRGDGPEGGRHGG